MDVIISAVEGNRQCLDGGAMFGNAPRVVWSKWLSPDELGRIELACRCLLIETQTCKILCETGVGAFFEPKLAERFGVQSPTQHLLIDNLAELGVSADSIDWIILSHLHFDHAGGLLSPYRPNGSQEIAFPNAKVVVGREAYERALSPHVRDRASFVPQLMRLLDELDDRLVVVDGDAVPGLLDGQLRFRYSHGHTPGQMHTVLTGTSQTIFFCGDLIPGVPWLHVPITMGYDRFPEQLINEKQGIYDQLDDRWWLFFTHDPQVAAARCMYDGKKWAAGDTVYPKKMAI